ncbi:MAG: helix-turn-helix domain-containing protein [Candidatus Paceibacterota bacterium]
MADSNELRKLRKYHDLTHEDMAELIGVDKRTYVNKETGITQFKANEMFIISKKFNRTIEEIFLPTDFMNHEVSVREKVK